MHKTSDSYIKNINDSKVARGEKNDCVVRALAASFDMTYDEAHHIAKTEFGRKDKNGTPHTCYTFKSLQDKGFKINGKSFKTIPYEEIRYVGSTRYISEKNKELRNNQPIVVQQLLNKFPKGRYFVLVKQHAFSLIDGVIVGNHTDGTRMRAKVLNLIQVEE